MAKRPEQSLDEVGQSLLSQQSASRAKYDKARRRDERKQKIFAGLLAGQSLVTSALKRRTKEIKDAGTISKAQSALQAANFNSLTPIYEAIDPYTTYEDFEKEYRQNPDNFNYLRRHLSPYVQTYLKQPGGKDMNDVEFQANYNLLENNVVKSIVSNAFKTKEQYKRGISAIADEVGIDKNNMWKYFTGIDVNSLDGIKAQKLNKMVDQYGTSLFTRGNMRGLGNALTFGWVKERKGEPNIFKDFDEEWRPLSEDIRTVFDNMNLNTIISTAVKENAPALRDHVARFEADPEGMGRIEAEYSTLESRINDGSWFWKGDTSPDRYSKFKEDRINDLTKVLDREDNAANKQRIFKNIGALSNRLGDPSENQFRQQFIHAYTAEFEMEIGSPEHNKFVNSLKDSKTRDQLAMNFVLSQVITDESGSDFQDIFHVGGSEFTFDFSKIDQLVRPSFVLKKDRTLGAVGTNQFEATEVYNSSNAQDQELNYKAYVKSILTNYTRSNLNTSQLTDIALNFMQSIPPPTGEHPQDIIDRILEDLSG